MKGFILPRSSARTPNPRLTQSQELYSQPLTNLRSRLDALERGSSHSRDRQHLATSARQLASRFDENVPSHELVIRDVLVVAIHALGSEGEVQELRRIQTQFVRFAGGGTVSGEEVRRYTKDILSQIMNERDTAMGRFKSLAIFIQRKGGKTVYHKQSDSIEQLGHNLKFGVNRGTKLPDNMGDLSITEKYEDHSFEVKGKRNAQTGHNLEFD